MYHPIGLQKTIKMTSHNKSKISSGKVILKRNKDDWEISLKAFWTEPVNAQMFIVGKTARKVLDIKAAEGAYSANKKLSYVMWNDFIMQARMIVVISKDIPILKASIPPLKEMDVYSAMTIIRYGNSNKITAKTKNESVKKEVEQKFTEEQKEDVNNKQQIKSILKLRPYDRKTTIEKKKPAHLHESCENSLIPMNWSTDEIDKCLKNEEVNSPFLCDMPDALFGKIDITDAIGFSHMILARIKTNEMYVYMLCIPGSAFMPPNGLSEFNRWIPALKGGGYWVKYITKEIAAVKI